MKMEKPEQEQFSTTNESEKILHPGVTVNQIFLCNPHHNKRIPTRCMDADYFYRSPYTGAHVKQHVELMQHREPEGGGATSARINLHHPLPGGSFPHPPETMQSRTSGECCCWNCGPRTIEPTNRETTREDDEYSSQLHGDTEEELELPLPLKGDDEWECCSPVLLPHHCVHKYDLHHTTGARCNDPAGGGQYNLNPVNSYPPQSCHHCDPCQHRRPWSDPHNRLEQHDSSMYDNVAQGSVSVNVPQFSAPPVEGVSQVSVLNLNPPGAERSVSHPHEKRRTVSLPDECRNIFITYSLDVSSEMVPFVDFLRKQGFRPAIDLFDNPIRHMDINQWKDSYLKDPSTLIIIAISPKYQADIEGCVVDSHGLHTKYIHSMMQNEFIQQGSLNFRFIPVLFLSASQKHVPNWLQNTRVYRWPQDAEDLVLRLLREERYVPPPVPVELTLIIRPVTPSAAATL